MLLSQDEIRTAIDFWKKNSGKKRSLQDIMQLALGNGNEEIPVDEVEASGWIKEFLEQLKGEVNLEVIDEPSGFKGILRPYQKRGFSWLLFLRRWGLGACLADDMGLGKTPQTLASIQHDWQTSEKKQPVLLICPTSLTGNWQKEAEKFTPDLPVHVHHGMLRKRGSHFKEQALKHGLVVTTYGLLYRDQKLLEEIEWKGIILDEAQNIKNAETKQARSAFALKAGYKVALTGTPIENNVGDLWSVMHFLNPGFLGSETDFKRNFFTPIQLGSCQQTTEKLKEMTQPFILRRIKTDKTIISDLPEKMEMTTFCSLTKEQVSLYEAAVREGTVAIEKAEGIERKGLVLAVLTKLKQICNHPSQYLNDGDIRQERSGKLSRLTEMLEEVLSVGDSALIFTQYRGMGDILKEHLQNTIGQEVMYLHGGTPKKQRDKMVDRFQAEEGPKLFILSLKAAGTGLNLTRANHVFHIDRWWNPAVENQATDRAFRIGQKKNVHVHKFVCGGTLEERIDEMIEKKKEVAQNVVGSGEGWLTELSTNELKKLFTLGV